LLIGVLAVVSSVVPAGAQSEAQPQVVPLESPTWAVALEPTTLRSQPDDGGEAFVTLRPLAPLQILGYAGDWAYVYNPRSKGTAFVNVGQLGPGDPPSSYVERDPPPIEEELERQGRVQQDTPLSFYPTSDDAAAYTELPSGSSVEITGSLHDDDGQEWYRTADGDYLPASAVTFPSAPTAPSLTVAPSAPVRTFAGRWIDVDLSLPARMTAYEGSTPVRTMLTIFGRGRLSTPVGTFSIIRRVANETMDSSTIGIPRNGPGGYYLKNVLFTQYFLPGGQSIHYNYWSSNWGYPGSHGCLGLSYADAAFMWSFAGLGTPVSIHY
jgi:lipoprotein-anchoring transpeptidase ErfK/SrfK